MFTKRLALFCIIGSLSFTPATRVEADGGDIAGGVIGGIIGGVIVNEGIKHRERQRQQVVRTVPRVSSATRAMNRETQESLNYFGFAAGTPDGILGRRSRGAISQYQAHMGYPATGYLNEYERQFLVTSYRRALTGGAATARMMAEQGMGTRGLLIAYRDEAAGIYGNTPTATSVPEIEVESASNAGAVDTQSDSTNGGLAALPNFMTGTGSGPSLASHCNQVSLVTSSNGGFVTAASMSDPGFALNEQFCLARTYAIADGEALASGLQGVSSSDLEAQCQSFGPAMREHVAALSLKPHQEVMSDVSSFILSTGMSPAQLSGTARICLSSGYRTDNMGVALGSALILTVLGEKAYAELMGHHLSQGFGTSKRPDLALAWYEVGLNALDSGAEAVFAPGNPERTNLIRRAAFRLNAGNGDQAQATGQNPQPASTLPSFNIAQ